MLGGVRCHPSSIISCQEDAEKGSSSLFVIRHRKHGLRGYVRCKPNSLTFEDVAKVTHMDIDCPIKYWIVERANSCVTPSAMVTDVAS